MKGDISRSDRRVAYALERSERRSGRWTPLTIVPKEQMEASRQLARERFGTTNLRGWTAQVDRVYRNGWLAVMVRMIPNTCLGVPIEHAAIRTALNDELGWKEMQRIKDEIFGIDRMAIEVYPRREDLVDAADMYHLWVFPAGYRFDFGLNMLGGQI